MVRRLLDTSIVVDVLRGYTPARLWLAPLSDLGIMPVVWLQVLEGADNRQEEQRAVKLLTEFELVEIGMSDFFWAIEKTLTFHLSHDIESSDRLIAAPPYRLQLPLYTTNLKHFAPLLGSLAQRPY